MIGALATTPGPWMAGAYMKGVYVLLTSPASGATNTSTTVTLYGKILDPFTRTAGIGFQLDRSAVFTGPDLQTSSTVNGRGWADTPLSWVSSVIPNGGWYYRGRAASVTIGAGPNAGPGRYRTAISFVQGGGAGIPRSLYLYVNKTYAPVTPAVGSNARALYLYVSKTYWALSILARSLYLYENRTPTVSIAARALYLYHDARDGEVSPYLNHISPSEQYVGGQVDLYGDGFGGILEAAAGATITVDSTNGGNVKENAVDRTAAAWVSNGGGGAWIRFTFGAAKKIVSVALEGSWGVPVFRFSDGGGDVTGGSTVPANSPKTPEYPVGTTRTLYTLPTPRTTTYVEIRTTGGGATLNEVWIYEETVPPQAAETSRAVLNLGLVSEQTMGIVSWANRSPNWYPANGGVAPLPAATVTVPAGAVSGLVQVEETT